MFGGVAAVTASIYGGGRSSTGMDRRPAGRVLVTEFADGTDQELGAVVSEALRIDLAQSRALELVDRADITKTLALMGVESSAPISAEVARTLS